MRVLTVASRLPRPDAPGAGTLVLDRIRAIRDAGAEVRIIAPVPWPRKAPHEDEIDGMSRRGVRYSRIPVIGTRFEAAAYARAIRAVLAAEVSEFKPDVIDVHDLYPDAVAVLSAAAKTGLPVVVTAHGADVKVTARLPAIHEKLQDALPTAAAVIAVTADLAADLMGQRIFRHPVEIIENGIDVLLFRPRSREEARLELGLDPDGPELVVAGNLDSSSRVKLLLSAMVGEDCPSGLRVHLLGDGRERIRLKRLSRAMGLGERAVFHGRVDRERVALFLAAGNGAVALGRGTRAMQAIREALACRIPVLAADTPPMRGMVMPFRQGVLVNLDLLGIKRGLVKLLEREWDLPTGDPRDWGAVGGEILSVLRRLF